jgi:predicted nuclease of restriction endonuclease-like RecB superfamily
VNFARFLPALLACKGWRMEAVVRTPWKTPAKLALSEADRFTSHLPPPEEFDSSLEQSLADKFGPMRDGWQLIREGDILHEHQKTFVPDFTFRHEDGTEVYLEIVGFWTPIPAVKRDVRQFRRHRILLAVPQARSVKALDYRRPGLQDDAEAPAPAGGPGGRTHEEPTRSKGQVERHPTGHYGNRLFFAETLRGGPPSPPGIGNL